MRVFDASALLVMLFDEPGAQKAAAELETRDGVASAVNYAEVISKLMERGLPEEAALQAWRGLSVEVHPLDAAMALDAARLRATTRSQGLSLGDRCCLALARQLGNVPVVTADRAWRSVKGFHLTFVR